MAYPTIDIAGNSVVYSLGRKIAKLTDFAHDFAPDYNAVGGVVKMPILSAQAGIFDKDSNNYEQNSTVGTASITLSAQYVAGFSVSPKQMSDGLGAYANLFQQMGEDAGRAIARSVEGAVVGQVLSSTNTPATLALTKAGFAGLYKTLLEVLGMDVVNLQGAIETGMVDNFLGFHRVLASGAVDAGILGFIAERGAIGVAGRRVPLLEGYPVYEEFIDKDTGIPATLVGFLKYATGDYFITATALFGTNITNAGAIVPLVAA